MDLHEQLKRLEEERKTLLDERANILAGTDKQDQEKTPADEQKQDTVAGRSLAAVDEDLGKNKETTAAVLKQIGDQEKTQIGEETLNSLANELIRLAEERKAAEQSAPRQQEGSESAARPPPDATASRSIDDIDKDILKAEAELKSAASELKSRFQAAESTKEISGETANAIARAEGGPKQRPPWEKDSVVEIGRSVQPEAHLRFYEVPERPEHHPRLHGGGESNFEGGHPSKDMRPESDKLTATGVWTTRDEVAGRMGEQLKDHYALQEEPTHIAVQIVPEGATLRHGTAGPLEGWGAGGGDQYQRVDSHNKVHASPGWDIKGDHVERRVSLDFNAAASEHDLYRNAAKLVEPEVGARWQKEHDADIASFNAQKDVQDKGDRVHQASAEAEALKAKHEAQQLQLDKGINLAKENFERKLEDKPRDSEQRDMLQRDFDKRAKQLQKDLDKRQKEDWHRYLEGTFKQLER
jgi:hypothetical protein